MSSYSCDHVSLQILHRAGCLLRSSSRKNTPNNRDAPTQNGCPDQKIEPRIGNGLTIQPTQSPTEKNQTRGKGPNWSALNLRACPPPSKRANEYRQPEPSSENEGDGDHSGLTIRITDPAPLVSTMNPKRSGGVQCIR